MTTKAKKTFEQLAAEAWQGLRDCLLDFENKFGEHIDRICKEGYWKPFGANFTEAWKDRMGDSPLAKYLLPYVVYAMDDSGASPADITEAVRGVGLDVVKGVLVQKKAGTPASAVKARSQKDKLPKPTTQTKTIFLQIPELEDKKMDKLSELEGRKKEDICIEAIRKEFAWLERKYDK
jgi:hypothetical protein